MSDLPPESRPAPPPEPDPQSTRVLPPDAPPPPPKQRLSERVWDFRSVIAVALASVIVGGLGGAALASVAQDDDEGRFGRGPARFGNGPGGGPGGGPGQLDERQRERMKEWREQRQQQRREGQRWWGQDGPPVVPPSGVPTPARPTPTG